MKHFFQHLIEHPWYYFKEYQIMELISGLLSVGLTVFAMWWIDKRAAKRWTQEGYLKRKIELEIEIRKVLLNIKNELYPLSLNKEMTEKEKYTNLSLIKSKIYDIKRKNLNGPFYKIIDNGLKTEYNLKLLLEEYIYFNKNIENFIVTLKNFYMKAMQSLKDVTEHNSEETLDNCLNLNNYIAEFLEMLTNNIPQQ